MIREAYRFSRKIKNKVANLIEAPVIVLIYHRVADLECDPQLLSVSVENFRKQMQFLKGNYHFHRFEEHWTPSTRPGVVITFDDGYSDNYLNALPILEDLDIPATFFITSSKIDSKLEFWWDDLERLILMPKILPPRIELQINGKDYYWILESDDNNEHDDKWTVLSNYMPSSKYKIYMELHQLLKPLDSKSRDQILSHLAIITKQTESGRDDYLPMSHQQLISLSDTNVSTIGAHTRTHPQLSVFSIEEQYAEIKGSKESLEQWLGEPISVFAYPFGSKNDYDKHSISVCRDLNFKKAASNYPGVYHSWTSKFQIPRHIVRNWDTKEFEGQLKDFI